MGRPAPKVDKHQTCSREASLRANPNDTEASDGLIPRTIRKLIKSCAVDVFAIEVRAANARQESAQLWNLVGDLDGRDRGRALTRATNGTLHYAEGLYKWRNPSTSGWRPRMTCVPGSC
jgi:hypothetical protein